MLESDSDPPARLGREVTRPSRARREFRNHRLHHFKNEHFWHGITNTLSDTVLGTNPDQRQVSKSRTARTLDPGPASGSG